MNDPDSRQTESCSPATAVAAVFDVRAFGAVGDGVADDGSAIQSAAKALSANRSGTLLFPAGIYRHATPGTAARFDNVSNLTVQFDAGAMLLMDNLRDGLGTGNGILIQGRARNIAVLNAHVKWKTFPSQRGFGFGIELRGYPSESQQIGDVVVRNVTVEGAPQAGAVFMGCSDVSVGNFTAVNTLADGLHFNACRRVRADDITGINTGDDTLAFVTYYGPTTGKGPFSEPSLGAWSNSDSIAANIRSTNSRSNGCRIAGSLNVSVSNLIVTNAIGSAIEISSSVSNGSSYKQTIAASRGVAVDGMTVEGCKHAVLVHVGNADGNSDPAFWHFDGYAKNVVARNTRSKQICITAGAVGLFVAPTK